MTIQLATVLNGYILSAKSYQFFIDSIPRSGIIQCNYKEKLEAENVWDDSRDGAPVGTTSGRYSVESFSMTFLRAKWLELMPYLATKGLGSIGAARFTTVVEVSEPLDPVHTCVDTLSQCRIVGIEDDYQEDIKASVVKLDLMALFLLRNGVPFWDPKRALPI